MLQFPNGYFLHQGYRPGVIGTVSALFGQAFSTTYGFGSFFECKVAKEMATFMETYNPDHSRIWSLEKNGRIYGSITLDGTNAKKEGAHVRWFMMDPQTRGFGLGQILLDQMIEFARTKKYSSIYLYTLADLEPAGTLYRQRGFILESRFEGDQWGNLVTEEKLRLTMT